MEELKQYRENSYYNIEDIAEQLIKLSNLDMPEGLKEELETALYNLKAMAENKYNNDYFRVLYNVLLVITGNETFQIRKESVMTLREYLKELKIDQIEDDTEFCDKEYNAIMGYCTERKFLITDDDLVCIVNRGLNDSFEYRRAEYIKNLWLEFGEVPMDLETKCIEEEWNGFAAGWHRTSICDWFEESYGVSVAKDLMGLQEENIMAKYIVDYYETYGKSYEVEANSKEEAEKIIKEDIAE